MAQALMAGLGITQMGMSLLALNNAEKTYEENKASLLAAGQENASRAIKQGKIKVEQARYNARVLEGENKAAIAGSGGHMSGSSLDVLMAQDVHNYNNEQLILWETEMNTRSAMIETYNNVVQLNTNMSNARINTFSNLLNMAAGTYSSINNATKMSLLTQQQIYNAQEMNRMKELQGRDMLKFKYGGLSLNNDSTDQQLPSAVPNWRIN